MIRQDIDALLSKYFCNEASLEELNILKKWIENPNNEQAFINHVKINYGINYNMQSFNINKAKANLSKKIKNERRAMVLKVVRKSLKYAAIVAILVSVGYFLTRKQSLPFTTPITNAQNQISPKEEHIKLRFSDGDTKIIENKKDNSVIKSISGDVLVYQNNHQLKYKKSLNINSLLYNELLVPYGKQVQVTLSDGTLVYLNAGSSLKFPVNFLPGKLRKVFLTGEAFFDVSQDKAHPFVVNYGDLNIKVLGTKFNVSAYPEDFYTDVVLVEGSVAMIPKGASEDEGTLLKPGNLGRFNKNKGTIDVEIINTSIRSSWKKGNIVFRNSTFENIIKKLERHYNVVIIINNTKLAKQTFNATIETNYESIEDVLFYFNKVHQIEYEIVNNKIIIN